MIDWTYPNIIIYVTTGRIDTDALRLVDIIHRPS